MRIAILSDIHGNLTALRAALDDVAARGPFQMTVANGDHMFGGPRPTETWEEMKSRGLVLLRGNMDRDLGSGEFPPPPMGGRRREKIREVFQWTLDNVAADVVKAAAALPWRLEVAVDSSSALLITHANARNVDDFIWSDTPQAELEWLVGDPAPGMMVVGHIHAPLDMLVNHTHVVRAGSVGLKYEAHWFNIAHWADVRWDRVAEEWTAQVHEVEWDHRAEIKAGYAANYPAVDILPGFGDR